ncbi:MAG: amidohydrolase family protein, partial [Acidimicrobiales bacterium]
GSAVPVLAGAADEPGPDHRFDLVVAGGRVMDPASGFDQVADVGIDGGTVTAINGGPLEGRRVIEADGRVVAPGFIDILSYDPNPFGIWFKIADGVTTNLGMHGINANARSWLARFSEEGSPAHFGGAFDDPWARAQLGIEPGQAATAAQVRALSGQAEEALAAGWIGIDLEPEYTPGIDAAEIVALARVAAGAGVPVFFHGRYADPYPPGTNADTLAEVLATARQSGAAVHVDHLVSTGGTHTMARSLATLDAARGEGVDVTACSYPYPYWAAYLASTRFDPGWQERFDIGYRDLSLAGSGKRLTPTSFRRYRAENRLAVADGIPEADVRTALQSPWMIVASDGILEPGANNHPRGAGTFARVLGRYVREQGTLSLMDALGRMTFLPAQRLEGAASALRRKGRVQRGADADICVFDADAVVDRATVADPARPSVGIDWVLVGGQVVKSPEGLHRERRPGQPLRLG